MMDQTLKCQECGTVQAVTDRIFHYYTVSHRRPWHCSTECRAAALIKKRAASTKPIGKQFQSESATVAHKTPVGCFSMRKSRRGFLGVAQRMIAAAAIEAESGVTENSK